MAVAPTSADPEGHTSLGNGVRAAAIRELFEEGNILLAYQGGNIPGYHRGNVRALSCLSTAFQERGGSLIDLAHAEHLGAGHRFSGLFCTLDYPGRLPQAL